MSENENSSKDSSLNGDNTESKCVNKGKLENDLENHDKKDSPAVDPNTTKNPQITVTQELVNKHEVENNDEQVINKPNKSEISEENSADIPNSRNIHYEGDVAIYTDPETNTQYQWDKEKNQWNAKTDVVYGFEDDTHVYTDTDGTKYFWDKDKSAWFPKVDEDFMARYQMNYGFVDNTNTEVKKPIENEVPKVEAKKKVKGEKRKASDPTWFEVDETQNTNVYVSNLPTDIEEQEFIDLMQKCGLIMRDVQSGKFKVKLYRESGTNFLKGDALCTYMKIESVDLALNVLDGYEFKGSKIEVQRAKFQMKGEFDPKLKPKMKKKKDKQKIKKQQEKLFDWRPEKVIGERAKHERIVIVRNLFDPNIFDTDVGLILELQEDLREECAKYGVVRKVIIYDRHPEGVAQINMSIPEEADQVVSVLNGRWFMKRQLTAEIWDGRTKFKIAETDSEIKQRLDKWDEFLEGGEKKTNHQNSEKDEKERNIQISEDTENNS